MTFADFEEAKRIQHKVGIASGNLVALRRIADTAVKYPLSRRSYKLRVDDDPNLELLVDADVFAMMIKYYEQEVKTLNEQFAALGEN